MSEITFFLFGLVTWLLSYIAVKVTRIGDSSVVFWFLGCMVGGGMMGWALGGFFL